MQFNRSVTKHSYGKKDVTPLDLVTESVAASQFLDQKLINEHHDKIERDVQRIERKNEEKRSMSAVTERSILMESQIPYAVNKLNEEGRLIVFKDIMFEMFMGSLVLDESFKIAEEYSFRSLLESYIDDNGGFNMIKQAYARTKSPILKQVMEACDAIAGKVCTRKMCECQQGSLAVTDIKFDLNEDEKEDLKIEKQNLSIDQLSDAVKTKVINVIKEEKTRQAKEEELQNDLENLAETDGTTVQEAYTRYVIPGTTVGIEEASIFNSIQRNCAKVAMEALASIRSSHLDDGNAEEDLYVNTSTDDINHNEFRPYTMKDASAGEYNLRTERNEYEIDSSNPLDDESYALDLDLILAESITRYTLMEMAHTIKLEEFNYSKLQKLSQNLLN